MSESRTKTEKSEAHVHGYFRSYENSDLEKTLQNLLIDANADEKRLLGIVAVRNAVKVFKLPELEGAIDELEGRISQRTGYTRGLIADARAELEFRHEGDEGWHRAF